MGLRSLFFHCIAYLPLEQTLTLCGPFGATVRHEPRTSAAGHCFGGVEWAMGPHANSIE